MGNRKQYTSLYYRFYFSHAKGNILHIEMSYCLHITFKTENNEIDNLEKKMHMLYAFNAHAICL